MKKPFLTAVAVIEFAVILYLAGGIAAHTNVLGGGDSERISVTLPENKQIYANENWQYEQREQMFIQGQSRKVDICFLGDSITQRLEWQEYYPNRTVANRGIGSDTTLGALARLDSVIANEPDVISILLGINDLAQRRTPEEIAKTYTEIVYALKEALPKTDIVVSSVLPVREKADIPSETILAVNAKLKQMCTECEIVYVDAFSVLADENNFLKEEYAIDSVHLTVDGYLEYLKCIDEAIKQ